MECRIPIDEYLQEIHEKQQMPVDCPVHAALELVQISLKHACGKTVYCRDGLLQIRQIITDISNGKGQREDLMTLADICGVLKNGSQCSLTDMTADQVQKSLEEHRGEWEKHCAQKQCSAMICKGCYSLYIDPSVCTGCGECRNKTGSDTILGAPGMIHILANDMELKENGMEDICPHGAIKKAGPLKPQVPGTPVPVGTFKPAAGLLKKRRRTISS